jgi:hypothetical protein
MVTNTKKYLDMLKKNIAFEPFLKQQISFFCATCPICKSFIKFVKSIFWVQGAGWFHRSRDRRGAGAKGRGGPFPGGLDRWWDYVGE